MEKAGFWIVTIIAVVILTLSIRSCKECQNFGGIPVRGAFWWECIKK